MKDELKNEIIEDFDRAKNAFASAKRNFEEEDMFTAANRSFVACENAVYACMKLKFGGTTISRKRIILKIHSISPIMMELYERSYDLRVQADYGRKSKNVEFTQLSPLFMTTAKNIHDFFLLFSHRTRSF